MGSKHRFSRTAAFILSFMLCVSTAPPAMADTADTDAAGSSQQTVAEVSENAGSAGSTDGIQRSESAAGAENDIATTGSGAGIDAQSATQGADSDAVTKSAGTGSDDSAAAEQAGSGNAADAASGATVSDLYDIVSGDTEADSSGYIFKLRDDVGFEGQSFLSGIAAAIIPGSQDSEAQADIAQEPGIAEIASDENTYKADSLGEMARAVDNSGIEISDIEYIEPDYIMSAADDVTDDGLRTAAENAQDGLEASAAAVNDAYYSSAQYNLPLMDVPYAWTQGIDGDVTEAGNSDDVIVAVIDTGIIASHEDFDSRHILSNKARTYINVAASPDAVQDKGIAGAVDDNGHGTEVSGIIMASKDNSLGIAGIAPDVNLLPIKAGNAKGDFLVSDVVCAIDYAIYCGADVINMSISGKSSSEALKAACDRAQTASVITVAAAGNSGDTTDSYPAMYDSVTGVGSVGSTGAVSGFSQRTPGAVYVSAPGENIESTSNASAASYIMASGTSFSSPEVAALAAMCRNMDKKSCTPALFRTLLQYSSTDLGATGYDALYGYGVVNFARALNIWAATISAPAAESSAGSTSKLNFSVKNEEGTVLTTSDAGFAIRLWKLDDKTETPLVQNTGTDGKPDGTYTLGILTVSSTDSSKALQGYACQISCGGYITYAEAFYVLTPLRTVSVVLQSVNDTVYLKPDVKDSSGAVIDSSTVAITDRYGDTLYPLDSYNTSDTTLQGTYPVRIGESYSYTVSKDSYYPDTGVISTNSTDQNDLAKAGKVVSMPVVLTSFSDAAEVRFTVKAMNATSGEYTDISSFETNYTLTITNSAGNAVGPYLHSNWFLLPADTYTYNLKLNIPAMDYEDVTGTITVESTDIGAGSIYTKIIQSAVKAVPGTSTGSTGNSESSGSSGGSSGSPGGGGGSSSSGGGGGGGSSSGGGGGSSATTAPAVTTPATAVTPVTTPEMTAPAAEEQPSQPVQVKADEIYSDVPADSWYDDAVSYVVTNGYFKGLRANEFGPEAKMTRAMFVTVLGRFAGIDPAKYGITTFGDVDPGSWYGAYVAWAVENGIVNGQSADLFGSDEEITREEMTVMMYRFAKFAGFNGIDSIFPSIDAYPDATAISSWARDAMSWAVSTGLIKGDGSDLSPGGQATRAQVAQIIKNLANAVKQTQ